MLNEVVLEGGIPKPPPSLAELRLLPGVVEACERLRDLGFVLIVVTNQPDIARGKQELSEVDRMHDFLRERLPLDEIVVCPHDDVDDCRCRKPRPGMLLDAADRHDLDLAASFLVGDRWRDIEAARNAGVRAIYLDRGYSERKPTDPDLTVASLPAAIPYLESARTEQHTVQRGTTR